MFAKFIDIGCYATQLLYTFNFLFILRFVKYSQEYSL